MNLHLYIVLVTIQVLGHGSTIAHTTHNQSTSPMTAELPSAPPSSPSLPLPLPPTPSLSQSDTWSCSWEEFPHTWFKDPVNQMNLEVLYVLESLKLEEGNYGDGNVTDGIVTSQFSTLFLLGELFLFTEGYSRRQFEQWLRNNRDDIEEQMLDFIDEIRSRPHADVQILSAVFIQKNLNVTNKLLAVADGQLGNDHTYVDFVYPEAAANDINLFLSLYTEKIRTNGEVLYGIPPDKIEPGSLMHLANIIFFKNVWKTEFNQNLTRLAPFWRDAGSYKHVPFMKKTEKMLYAESFELNAEILTMSTSIVDFDFVLISPLKQNRVGTVHNVLNILMEDPQIFDNAEEEQIMTLVELTMPKFKLHSSIDMKSVLKQLGVTQIFDKRFSNMQGLFKDKQKKTFVSGIFHEAFVEVDEKGVDTAAFADEQFLGSKVPKVVLNVDRPFLFMIRFRGVAFIMGIYDGMGQD